MPEHRPPRLLLWAVGLTLVLVALVFVAEGSLSRRAERSSSRIESGAAGPTVSTAAISADKCATCHASATPGIVTQHLDSKHAKSGIGCANCHEVQANHPGGIEHQGTWVVSAPTPNACLGCHERETREFWRSRHALPAWAGMTGTDDFTPEQKAQYDAIEEVMKTPVGIGVSTRNSLYDIEGPMVTAAACESCHAIGRPNLDGSAGTCSSCHLRHTFSLEQARKPETCNACHIGPDHPQWEIYHHSAHGVAYTTTGANWNWSKAAGRLTPQDIPAATCQVCHMSGFGSQGTTHDVGDRLSLYLFMPMSAWRPGAGENRERMKGVCSSCHSREFIDNVYLRADAVTARVSGIEAEAAAIITRLENTGLLSKEPFDHPIKFEAFELWHHWGRTAKFGAYMFGADYTQWHGIYEMVKSFSAMATEAEAIEKEGGLHDAVDWPLAKRTPLLDRLNEYRGPGRIMPPAGTVLPQQKPGGEKLMSPANIPVHGVQK